MQFIVFKKNMWLNSHGTYWFWVWVRWCQWAGLAWHLTHTSVASHLKSYHTSVATHGCVKAFHWLIMWHLSIEWGYKPQQMHGCHILLTIISDSTTSLCLASARSSHFKIGSRSSSDTTAASRRDPSQHPSAVARPKSRGSSRTRRRPCSSGRTARATPTPDTSGHVSPPTATSTKQCSRCFATYTQFIYTIQSSIFPYKNAPYFHEKYRL